MNGDIFSGLALWLSGHSTLLGLTLFVTELFDVIPAIVLVVSLIGYFAFQGRLKNSWIIFWSSAINGLGVYILKYAIGAPRPNFALYAPGDPSFPSGHSAIAMTIAALLWLLRPKKRKAFWSALILLTPLVIGLTRIGLGVHYLKDVLAGYGVGLVSVLIGWFICRRGKDRVPRRQPWFPKTILFMGLTTWLATAFLSSMMIWRQIILK